MFSDDEHQPTEAVSPKETNLTTQDSVTSCSTGVITLGKRMHIERPDSDSSEENSAKRRRSSDERRRRRRKREQTWRKKFRERKLALWNWRWIFVFSKHHHQPRRAMGAIQGKVKTSHRARICGQHQRTRSKTNRALRFHVLRVKARSETLKE